MYEWNWPFGGIAFMFIRTLDFLLVGQRQLDISKLGVEFNKQNVRDREEWTIYTYIVE